MPDLDFSAPAYAAVAHDSRKQVRPKRERAAPTTVDGEAVSAPKPVARKSRADRLYRGRKTVR